MNRDDGAETAAQPADAAESETDAAWPEMPCWLPCAP